MRKILIFFLISAIYTIAEGSFINSMYPRYKLYTDNEDPGEPLYLTKYIEKGDIETVSYCSFKI